MANYILKLPITHKLIKHAEELSLTESLNKSITKGERNVMGTLGELCYITLLSHIYDLEDIEYEPNYNYDLRIGGVKVDVKSKQRTVAPQSHYAASIVAYSKDKQLCDYYAFTTITVGKHDTDFKDFYFLGHIKKSDYFQRATFMRKGQSDGGNHHKGQEFKIRADCYNLNYSELDQYPLEGIEGALENGFVQVPW